MRVSDRKPADWSASRRQTRLRGERRVDVASHPRKPSDTKGGGANHGVWDARGFERPQRLTRKRREAVSPAGHRVDSKNINVGVHWLSGVSVAL
jgi:hypothetical protein